MKSRARLRFAASHPLLVLLLLGSSCGSPSAKSVGTRDAGSTTDAASADRARVVSRPELIADYEKLAGEILETREREIEVVRSIVEATMEDARATHERARRALASGGSAQAARPALEDLATLVGLLATEGDASVARIRKRLVEGGHHYNPLHSHERDPAAAHGGPEGAHHAGGTKEGHAAGEAPAHHADGKKEGHATGDAPGHHAGKPGGTGEQPPAHHAGGTKEGHATGDAPGHKAGQQPGATGAPQAGQPPGHHAGEKGEGHHADAQDKAGHHKDGEAHHADGSSLHGYDPGFVVVNRKSKKVFLDASRALSLLSTAPVLNALDLEWSKVEAAWTELEKSWK